MAQWRTLQASSAAPARAPGSLVMIFGSQLASGLSRADTVPLSNTIGSVSVTFNNITAPLQFVSENAIQAQVPWNVLPDPTLPGTANIVVTSGGIASQPVSVPINPFSPAIYRLSPSSSQAMAFNPDGTVAGPTGAIAGLQSHPASPSDTLTVYANGLGAVTPSIASGTSSSDAPRSTVTTPVVLIQGANAQVTSSGLSAQFPGMNQLSVIVPAGITSSDAAPIQIQVGGITTTAQITIAILTK
jgi:uncharacterized protein (TIGR03437 family)